jgi:type I restriction enzyme S subunit
MKLNEGFPLAAAAPDGIVRLRDLILSLAVQGKLVPQDPSDEPADTLLKVIRTEKDRLIAEGKIRRDKPLPEITHEEKPFALPEKWRWIRLGSAIELISGQHLGPSEYVDGLGSDIPYLTGPAEFGPCNPEPTRSTVVRRAVAARGDILITVKGSGVGKLNTVSQAEIAISRQLMAVRPILLNVHFVQLVLRAMGAVFQQKAVGIAIPGIAREDVTEAVIGLPPIAEQARIVAKVDELMNLCDELDVRGRLEAKQHSRLTATLFDALAASESPHALAENWARVAANFDLLLDRPEAVDTLEQAILQLAVRGLLVQQEPTDEPASELLKKIRAEKNLLIAKGKIGRDKPTIPIEDNEKSFELPAGWEWARFGDYIVELCTGPFGSMIHKEDYVVDGIPLINPSHMVDGAIRPDPSVSISEEFAEKKLSAYRLSAGDMVLARRGEVGRYAHVSDVQDGWICGTGSFFVKLANCIDRRYLGLVFEDPGMRMHLQGESVGMTMTNLNQRILLEAPLAVPPLTEQARIVARVEELRCLCAVLRERLVARQSCQAYFAEALVGQVASATPLLTHTDGLAAAA